MTKSTFLFLLILFSSLGLGAAQELRPPELKDVRWVPLVNIEAEEALLRLKENLKNLNVYIHYKAVTPSPFLVLLSGKKEDVLVCSEILAAIDRAHAEPTVSKPKVKYIPLAQIGARRAGAMIEELQEMAGKGLGRGRFILYPETADAGLFFIGTSDEAAAVQEFASGIDRPQYRTRPDVMRKWWREFSLDFLDTLQRVLSYLACAVFLLLLHAVVSHIPVLGDKYRKYMSIIWGKLLAGLKGQDFALSLIEAAASHGAAVAVGTRAASGRDRFSTALEAAKRYLKFRGMDADGNGTSALLKDMVAARMGAHADVTTGNGGS